MGDVEQCDPLTWRQRRRSGAPRGLQRDLISGAHGHPWDRGPATEILPMLRNLLRPQQGPREPHRATLLAEQARDHAFLGWENKEHGYFLTL